jgi:chloride channel protein, CIC family
MQTILELHTKSREIPPTLRSTGAVGFWGTVILTGTGAGVGAVVLTKLLEKVQHMVWPGPTLLNAAAHADAWRHIGALLIVGVLMGVGQMVLRWALHGK